MPTNQTINQMKNSIKLVLSIIAVSLIASSSFILGESSAHEGIDYFISLDYHQVTITDSEGNVFERMVVEEISDVINDQEDADEIFSF